MKKQNRNRKNELTAEEQLVARNRSPERLIALQDQLCTGFTFRWVTTSAFTGVLGCNYNNLLDSWMIAGTATTAYQLFDYIRIKKVTVRAILANQPGAGVSSATVTVEFPGLTIGTGGGGKQRTCTSMGTAHPAFVSLTPDPRSAQALFQAGSNNTAFVVRAIDGLGGALAGAIVELECVLRNSGLVNPAAVTSAVSGAQPGLLYFGGMDGARIAATAARSAFRPDI